MPRKTDEQQDAGPVRWCPDCRTKNPATVGPSWRCEGCGVVWMRATGTLELTFTNTAPVSPEWSTLLPDANSCRQCGKPRFHHWKVLQPHEWCSCPHTLQARAAVARWLS